MDISTTSVDGAVIVAPHGDIDLTTSSLLRSLVDQVIDDGAQAVVLDLSDVAFFDSTGLGVLVLIRRRLGDRLALASPRSAVRRLLEITKFDTVLTVTDSVADALTIVKT
jgi:anti-sigma B factor antagonist